MNSLITDDNTNKRQRNPRADANIFEVVTFSWLLKIFKIGWKRDLDENDLYTTLDDHKSSPLGNELEKRWRIEVASTKEKNQNPSLLRVLIQIFGPRYMFCGFLFAIIALIFQFLIRFIQILRTVEFAYNDLQGT